MKVKQSVMGWIIMDYIIQKIIKSKCISSHIDCRCLNGNTFTPGLTLASLVICLSRPGKCVHASSEWERHLPTPWLSDAAWSWALCECGHSPVKHSHCVPALIPSHQADCWGSAEGGKMHTVGFYVLKMCLSWKNVDCQRLCGGCFGSNWVYSSEMGAISVWKLILIVGILHF